MIRHDRVEKHRAAGKIFQKSISLPDIFFISQIPHKDGIKGKTLTFQMLSAIPGKAGQRINGRFSVTSRVGGKHHGRNRAGFHAENGQHRKDICHGCLPHGAEIVKDGSSLDRFLFYSSLHFFSTPTRIAPLGMA